MNESNSSTEPTDAGEDEQQYVEQDVDTSIKIAMICLYVIILMLSLVGNSLIIHLVRTRKNIRKKTVLLAYRQHSSCWPDGCLNSLCLYNAILHLWTPMGARRIWNCYVQDNSIFVDCVHLCCHLDAYSHCCRPIPSDSMSPKKSPVIPISAAFHYHCLAVCYSGW